GEGMLRGAGGLWAGRGGGGAGPAAIAGMIGNRPPSHSLTVAFIKLISHGVTIAPTKIAPPTVKVWAFFSTARAIHRDEGQQMRKIAEINTKIWDAGTLIAPSRTKTVAPAKTLAVTWKQP